MIESQTKLSIFNEYQNRSNPFRKHGARFYRDLDSLFFLKSKNNRLCVCIIFAKRPVLILVSMSKKVNLKTIANHLNLSPGTVSRVLNGKAKEFRISQETVKLVLAYVEKIGYSPNLIAKGLRASKTFTIGLIIPDISNPFFAIMARNIENAASKENYSILLVDSQDDEQREKQQLRNMISRKVDGIIAAPVGASYQHFLEIKNQGIPLVFVDRYFNDIDIPYVSSDNYSGAFEATKYLMNNGHQNIVLIKGDEATEPAKERKRGYMDALIQEGISIDEIGVTGSNEFSIENGYQSTKDMLAGDIKPTAIFALSNLIGLGVLKAVKEAGIKIPDNLSLLTFDDQPYVPFLDPPVTTVKQDSEKIGILAMEYIISRIDKEKTPLKSKLIPTTLMVRKSVLKR